MPPDDDEGGVVGLSSPLSPSLLPLIFPLAHDDAFLLTRVVDFADALLRGARGVTNAEAFFVGMGLTCAIAGR
jgi:hypothetical protein